MKRDKKGEGEEEKKIVGGEGGKGKKNRRKNTIPDISESCLHSKEALKNTKLFMFEDFLLLFI